MKQLLKVMSISAILACAASPAAALTLEFIGQQIIPSGTQFGGTTVGGLSGIDFDEASGSFIAISDDRSQLNPARYYSLDLALTATSFTGVTFTGVTTLRNTAGNPYPILQIDPEGIALLPGGQMVYSSEGDKNNAINAFVRVANVDGSYVRDLALPGYYQQTGPAGTSGLRNNLAFESITLSPDGSRVTTATENALIQDGPGASFGVGSPARILTFDLASGAAGAEYVYEVSPVASASTPPGAFSTNGLVELLDLGGGKYLAVERSFISGFTTPFSSTGNSIQVYEIDTNGATDISGLAAIMGMPYVPVSKTLLLDLDTLGIPLDNIEGIAWGPTLNDGSQSLIFVSDNNFSGSQFTQFLAFKTPAVPEPASWAMMILGMGLVGGSLRANRVRVRLVA
jgi:hypothetical protein